MVDAEYFLDRLFHDQQVLNQLLKKVVESQSTELLKLASTLIRKTVRNAATVEVKDSQPLESDSNLILFSDGLEKMKSSSCSDGKKDELCQSQVQVSKPNLNLLLSPESSDQEEGVNRESITNLDFPVYDPEEMREQEIIEVIGKNLFFLKAKLFEGQRNTSLHSDGKFKKRCGFYRLELMQLLNVISGLKCAEIKQTLLENEFLERVFDLFFDFPQSNILHQATVSFQKNLLVFLF